MTALGLLLILLAWILQLLHLQGSKKMHIFFLLAYAAGVSFIVMDSYAQEQYITGSLNLLTLCVVILIILRVKSDSKKH